MMWYFIRTKVIGNDRSIIFDKMIDLKIESGILAQCRLGIFSASPGKYFDYWIGQETDTFLFLRSIVGIS